MKLSTKSFSWK